jgi:hypothetical protein
MRQVLTYAVVSAALAAMLFVGAGPAAAGQAARSGVAARAGAGVGNMKPASGVVGTVVTIKGSGFTGATGVAFNGTDASTFTVDSDKQITATVAANTTTGPVTVTTPTTTLTSRKSFGVLVNVSLTACTSSGGNRNVPAGTYPVFTVGWLMSSVDFLKPFLSSTKTALTIDGKTKNAQKYWDKTGVDAGGGSWRTNFSYDTRVLLANGGDTITGEIHQFVKKEFSDGTTTYEPGDDLWSGLTSCTVHAV